MTDEVRHRSPELTYHEMRVMDIIAPRMKISDYAGVEDVEKLQVLEAAEVMRCIRESGLAIGPVINGKAELAEKADVISSCSVCERPARAERGGVYYCGFCLGEAMILRVKV